MPRALFNIEEVLPLISHSNAAPDHRQRWDGEKIAGLMLVGDQGLYLMSTGLPHLPRDPELNTVSSQVVYARGCDPERNDGYYEEKRRIFGGDDGVEYLPLSDDFTDKLESGTYRTLAIDLTTDSIVIQLES